MGFEFGQDGKKIYTVEPGRYADLCVFDEHNPVLRDDYLEFGPLDEHDNGLTPWRTIKTSDIEPGMRILLTATSTWGEWIRFDGIVKEYDCASGKMDVDTFISGKSQSITIDIGELQKREAKQELQATQQINLHEALKTLLAQKCFDSGKKASVLGW
jgi:hypothetical protein